MIYLVREQSETTSVVIKSDFDFLDRLIDSNEDEVDIQLEKLDGRISRQIDSKLFGVQH